MVEKLWNLFLSKCSLNEVSDPDQYSLTPASHIKPAFQAPNDDDGDDGDGDGDFTGDFEIL